MTSLSPFLKDNLKVTPTDSDQVEVTVTLPADLLVHYVRLLESLSGFFKFVNQKSKHSKAQSETALAERAKLGKQRIAEYQTLLAELYDRYIDQGLDRNPAIKQVCADLREANHPWSSPDLVRPNLIAAGRRGRVGRPRRKS